MRVLVYLFTGVFFGIVLYKSEAASWYRIFEMFEFASFHMYGIIGSALALGAAGVAFIKKKNIKPLRGQKMKLDPKEPGFRRYLYGGILFGLGWALAGACPGPMYVLAGAGYVPILVVLTSATLGTFVYGLLRNKLPH